MARRRRIAIVDGGSFALPYDQQLIQALSRRKADVTFYGSLTRYNAHFLEALCSTPGVNVIARTVSGTVAPRWRGLLNYFLLLLELWRRRARYDVVNLQFSALWPLDLPFFFGLRRRLMFTIHNAVPHGFSERRHRPTAWLAAIARTLVFPSESTHNDFVSRYGAHYLAKSVVLPHGLLPIEPNLAAVPYCTPVQPTALIFWSTVKPYKGVELFLELARCAAFQRRALQLEVHGAWAPELTPLREELALLGVVINDSYLDASALARLLARDAVFLMPYIEASQSGALYTLLNQGRFFICSDVGDLGVFMRLHGLQSLLLRERSVAAVIECLNHLEAQPKAIADAFARAQASCSWDAILEQKSQVYFGQ